MSAREDASTALPYNVGMCVTGFQIAAARALVGMSQTTLANAAKVTLNTIVNVESSGPEPVAARASTLFAIQRVLADEGVEFINHGQPGVRLRRR